MSIKNCICIKITGKQDVKKKKKTLTAYLIFKKKPDNKNIRGVALIKKLATLCTVSNSRRSTFLKPLKLIKRKK